MIAEPRFLVFLVDRTASALRNAPKRGTLDFVKLGAAGDYPDEIRDAKGRAGAYVIRDHGRIAYVGRATDDLYKAATRHFQRWNRSPSARRTRPLTPRDPGLTYSRSAGALALVPTPPNRAYQRQRELIDELSPRDNIHYNPGGRVMRADLITPAAASAAALDAGGAPLAAVDLAPPTREVRLAFARYLLSSFARQALADLGLVPGEDPAPTEGIPAPTRAFLVDRYPNGARSNGTVAGKVDAR